jgi:hypothetical protein
VAIAESYVKAQVQMSSSELEQKKKMLTIVNIVPICKTIFEVQFMLMNFSMKKWGNYQILNSYLAIKKMEMM